MVIDNDTSHGNLFSIRYLGRFLVLESYNSQPIAPFITCRRKVVVMVFITDICIQGKLCMKLL